MHTHPHKILILYANYGEGHKRAAQAIEESLRKKMPSARILSEDFLGRAFPLGDALMRRLYLQTFHWARSIYGYLYYKTKDLPADAAMFQMISYSGIVMLEKYILFHQPTIIISTFPALTGMLAKVKERSNLNFHLWCVLTDYVAHSQWLYRSVDQYFVPAEKIKKELISFGIDPTKILVTGIPVRASFFKEMDKTALLNKWCLHPNLPIVLISAGAFGVTNLEEVCIKLVDRCPLTQFLVICGRNRKLYQQIQSIHENRSKLIYPFQFVKEIHELMKVADLFITKAGGLSISEAMATQVPMILYKSLPGQEAENAKYLVQLGVAQSAEKEDELLDSVTHLLKNPKLLQSMKAKLSNLGSPHSPADAIAAHALQTLQNIPRFQPPLQRTPRSHKNREVFKTSKWGLLKARKKWGNR